MPTVLEEHLGYLQLPHRLGLYSDAIEQAVKPGDVVVDLGCGFGVLGMLCLQHGAAKVYGIDSSGAIEIARETAARAGLSDRYVCLAKSTFEAELPEKADVIICDHVGWFGLDYGILAMIRDAQKRFLKPGGIIIPQSVDLIVAGTSSETAYAKVDDWTGEDIPHEFHWLREHGANSKHGRSFAGEEIVTDPVRLGRVALDASAPDQIAFDAELTAQKDAPVHGIAGWFEAHLFGDIAMTNSPLDAVSIERLQVFLPFSQPFDAAQGDRYSAAIRWRPDENLLSWSVKPPGGAPKQKMSTWKSTIVGPADLAGGSDEPVQLNQLGEARQFILGLIDGAKTPAQIEAEVLAQRPDLLPSETATRDFVRTVLARDCAA